MRNGLPPIVIMVLTLLLMSNVIVWGAAIVATSKMPPRLGFVQEYGFDNAPWGRDY